MQELDYPFDAERIIKGKKRLKRQLLESGKATVKKKIAVLGGYTTSDIVPVEIYNGKLSIDFNELREYVES